ncbi:MAG: hypothetical protein ACLQVY_04685 [Limisphaerales bacterium]
MRTKPIIRPSNDPRQTELVGLIWRPLRYPFRLRAGDVIRCNDRLCRVIRVNECAAVVIMNQPVRDFRTRFDKPVRFQPPPATFRICSNSDVEILNHKSRL